MEEDVVRLRRNDRGVSEGSLLIVLLPSALFEDVYVCLADVCHSNGLGAFIFPEGPGRRLTAPLARSQYRGR
jgi:hypothetical protein